MILYKITGLETTNRILLYIFLYAKIIIGDNSSPDLKSVLNKCQNMGDCPAGEICENYDDMKFSMDYIVEAEILLG